MKKTFTMLSTSALLITSLHATSTENEIKTLQSDVKQLKIENEKMKTALESNAKSGFQLAGYASFDYNNDKDGKSAFSGTKFAPIFHYKYADIFQFEGEVEFTINEAGETEVELEYAAGTLFINDYMGLQMGKFLSPIGQFVQNQHPSWINKMPDAPLGFGHDGAAPSSNLGFALRGGLPSIGEVRSNYVIFVSNAPTYGIADDGDLVIKAEGSTTSNDAAKTVGGRFALNPIGNMEIGVSFATGEVSETINDQSITRNYDVLGADMMYNFYAFSLKAEYIQQKIGENPASELEGGTWKAWYTQLSYQFDSINFEPVARYGEYSNPEGSRSQWAIGLNYLFANNLIAKIAYESDQYDNNDEASLSSNDSNRILAQFAFGF